ncbi:MAG TPA: LysM peptidoglycan-binding domain-containing protein, partial [Candidatus Ozemobacteraceae bacterium]|nr:LysM peptidoglycan-binding domain-containing protein [Candidatus Ozemobacteraceae bacterium]
MKNTTRAHLFSALLLLVIVTFAASAPAFADKTYTMKDGDTLWDLSSKYYNDPTLYPIFLEVNDIDNPRMIPVGRVIIIPSFDEMKKVAAEPDPAKRQSMIKNLSGGSSSSSSSSDTGSTSDKKQDQIGNEDPDENKPIDP